MGDEKKAEAISLSLEIMEDIRARVVEYTTSRQKIEPTYRGDNKRLEAYIVSRLLGNHHLIEKVNEKYATLDEKELSFVTDQLANIRQEQKQASNSSNRRVSV